jgi:sugar lactone lactonase YvrE
MRVSNSLLNRGLALIYAVLVACVFIGCQSGEVESPKLKPVFFPPLPENPRLQFLKSFSGHDNLGANITSPFEKFILGEPEMKQEIAKPYGIAIFKGKLYICDVGKRMVEVIDLQNRTFDYLTKDRRLMNPVNIFITDDGTKYVADPTAGAVFVFDRNDSLNAILGKELKTAPIDVTVRGQLCYITDFNSNQVVVFDKTTGAEITRMGSKNQSIGEEEPLQHLAPGEFSLISDVSLDREGNIYVTDKVAGRITEFDNSGKFRRTIGRLGSNIDEFIRPKGIAIDRNDRIWVVDAGPEVAKIYDKQGRLLLFFGLPGNEPGMMNLPAKIVLDYDNVEFFEQYAVEGAEIEFLVLVSNQYGLNKISVYGFGSFPTRETEIIERTKEYAQEPAPDQKSLPQASKPSAPTKIESRKVDIQLNKQKEEIAELYQLSLSFYRGGQLEKAREGFVKVLGSNLIPARMGKTIEGYLSDINERLSKVGQQEEIAELYYRSMAFYRGGQLEEARKGFVRVLKSGLVPPEMAKTIEKYLADINNTLAERQSSLP